MTQIIDDLHAKSANFEPDVKMEKISKFIGLFINSALEKNTGKTSKCPRCKLPQDGEHVCQYCGYNLTQDKKRYIKLNLKKR